MLLWVAAVTVAGPAVMRGSRLFWSYAAARLRDAWRAVLSAKGARGGRPFVWGRGHVQRMLRFLSWVVSRWLEARVGGEGVYGDGGALMRGVEVVMVAACLVSDDEVRWWYVVVERGAGELSGDARRRSPCFGCNVVVHEDLEGPLIVGRKAEVR